MKTATISTLKSKLSEHIAWVKNGEEVLVTERGKPVARIIPVKGDSAEDAKRRELACRGIIRLGKGRISREMIDRCPLVRIPEDVLQRIINEEREDRV